MNELESKELNEKVATEVMEWHWDDAWGCLIPPEQKAKPSEMWSEWKPGAEGLFREPIKGSMVSGISYNGDSSKVILPKYDRDIAAAMQIFEKMKERKPRVMMTIYLLYGHRKWFYRCQILEESTPRWWSEDADTAPLAICKAALMAMEVRE